MAEQDATHLVENEDEAKLIKVAIIPLGQRLKCRFISRLDSGLFLAGPLLVASELHPQGIEIT